MRTFWIATVALICASALLAGLANDGRSARADGARASIDPTMMTVSGAALATIEADGI